MRRAVVAVAALLLLCEAFAAGPEPQAPHVYQGTIIEVHADGASLVVVTAVGMALRRVPMRTTSSTRIAEGVRSLAPRELERGTIVRAECHLEAGALVADRLDVVRAS